MHEDRPMAPRFMARHRPMPGREELDQRPHPVRSVFVEAGLPPYVLCVALCAMHLFIEGPLPWWQRLMGAMVGIPGFFLAGRYLVLGRVDRLPVVEFALFQAYVFWGLPTVLDDVADRLPVSEAGMTRALIAVSLFCTLLLCAYPAGKWLGAALRPRLDRLIPAEAGPAASIVIWPWLVLAVVGNTGLLIRLPQAVVHPALLFSSYIPLLAYTAQRSLGTGPQRPMPSLFPISTLLIAMAGMASGRMRHLLSPLVVSGVLFMLKRRRFPWRWAGAVVVLFVLLQPAKHAYRAMAWSEDEYRQSADVGLTASRWSEAITSTWAHEEALDRGESTIAGRLNNLSPIGLIFDMVPGYVPHVGTRHWKLLLVAPLPRMLYPDKPNFTEAINNTYSVTFGIQDSSTVGNSTAVFPIVSDGYWSFGWPGVVVVALAVGLLLGLFTSSFRLGSWAGLSISLTLFAEMRPVDHLVGQFGGVLQRILAIALLCWIVRLVSLGPTLTQGHRDPRRSWTARRP